MPTQSESGFTVGVEEIDVEHRQIARRVRQLATAVSDGRPEEIRGALKFLHASLGEHFAHEEAWMEDAGYPAVREHARLHASLVDAVAAARQRAVDQPLAAARTARDLVTALDAHMREEDLKLGRFHTARANLRLLAEAGPGAGPALTPIPGSLTPLPRRPGQK